MQMREKTDKKDKIFYLIILFALISFFGWCQETVYFRIRWKVWIDRGFLTLPFCTIYGFSLVAIYLIIGTPWSGRLKPLFLRAENLHLWLRIPAYIGLIALYFLCAAAIPTIAEFVTALFFDRVFGVTLWDYSYYKYDLFGYVCLEMTVFWGAVITVAMSTIWPLLEKLICKIPRRAAKIIAFVLAALLIADFIFNIAYLAVKGCHFALY